MSASPNDFNAQVIAAFRANGGDVGDMLGGMPVVLLHHTGARSGASRINPLAYLADDGRYVIFASRAGAKEHPAWYHNLVAHPEVEIEVGTERLPVVASEATGEERERLYSAQAARSPQFAGYERDAAPRVIPVIVLTPASAS